MTPKNVQHLHSIASLLHRPTQGLLRFPNIPIKLVDTITPKKFVKRPSFNALGVGAFWWNWQSIGKMQTQNERQKLLNYRSVYSLKTV